MEDFDRHYELRLTAEPSRFGVVRRIVQAHLRHWNLEPLSAPTVTGLNELLANVYQHVARPHSCTVRLRTADGALTVEVHDASPVLPRVLPPDPLSPGGRGLAIVAGLAKEWGVRPEEHGKAVWFTLAPLSAAAPLIPAEPLLTAALAWPEPVVPETAPTPVAVPALEPVLEVLLEEVVLDPVREQVLEPVAAEPAVAEATSPVAAVS